MSSPGFELTLKKLLKKVDLVGNPDPKCWGKNDQKMAPPFLKKVNTPLVLGLRNGVSFIIVSFQGPFTRRIIDKWV